MITKMKLSQRALVKISLVCGVCAILMVIILEMLDASLKGATHLGLFDLDKAASAFDVRFILDRWQDPPIAALAGATLGLSFLLIPLYGTALWIGSLFARDLITPNPGRMRRYMNALALAPIIAALCDIATRTMQLHMLIIGPDLVIPAIAWEAVILKWAGISIGILLSLLALLTAAFHRRKTK